MLLLLFQGDFYFTIFYSPSSAFFLRIARLRFGFSSVAGVTTLTPANSGSMRIRPQYSQGIIFLCILMSNWR